MANHMVNLNSVFQALGDPTRRAVVNRLIKASASVKELAEPFDMALPSFLKHLAVLEASGLISSAKNGRVRTCRLNPKRLAEAESWLSEQRRLWEGRTERLAEYVENLTSKEKEK